MLPDGLSVKSGGGGPHLLTCKRAKRGVLLHSMGTGGGEMAGGGGGGYLVYEVSHRKN